MQDNHRYIYFRTLDHTGTPTTSGYTLSITPFTFAPIFDDGTANLYSNVHILWDFGDGTTSRSITATHQFKMPGWYNVKCYVLGENGQAHESSFSQLLLIKDYIIDNLAISGTNGKNEAGKLQNPFVLYRFNSWQSYEALSSTGYTINLDAYNTNAPLFYEKGYLKDKWGHLKPSSRFVAQIFNSNSNLYEENVVNSVQTENNREIYVKLNSDTNNIVFCDKNDFGSCFAGSSGSKLFYFIDDLPSILNEDTLVNSSVINASFDTTKFKDKDNFYKNYPTSNYNILNVIKESNAFSQVLGALTPASMTITANGMDDNNLNELIPTFNIFEQKFVGQKIPFVVRLRDDSNYAAKSSRNLTLNQTVTSYIDLSENEINIQVFDVNDSVIDPSFYKIYTNFDVLSNETYGGYYKGYIVFNKPVENVKLVSSIYSVVGGKFLADSTLAYVTEPASNKAHKLTIQYANNDPTTKDINDQLMDISVLTGVYTSCITSQRQVNGGIQKILWLADADSDIIRKYNTSNTKLSAQINLGEYYGKSVSPSNICSNFDTDAWVTLYDTISTIRIGALDMQIKETIAPYCILNNTISPSLTSYVQPASVEVDRFGNLSISYSNPSASFIEKYKVVNGSQVFVKSISAEPNYYFSEIISDTYGNIWGIMKDAFTNTKILSNRFDKLFTVDLSGNNFQSFPVNASLWNIVMDCNENAWATCNINEIVRLDSISHNISKFNLNSNSSNDYSNYLSNHMGLACSTDNTMYVIDNFSKRILYFTASDVVSSIKSFNFIKLNTSDISPVQDMVNGYGDWNGFRHIYKFQRTVGDSIELTGNSSIFSVYNADNPKYDIRKVNENFGMGEQINSYVHQEYLKDSSILMNDFIKTAVGVLSSDPNVLGKRIYEKIANFGMNNSDVDTCRIESLKSMYDMLDEYIYSFNTDLNSIPANLKRLMDIFSVKFTKLRGSRNKERYNFDKKGYIGESNTTYGINLGEQLNYSSAIITAGTPIVAFEKFSETYKFIDTNITADITKYNMVDGNSYTLSSYSDDWGWGLVLPDNFTKNAVPNYYNFYTYISTYNNEQTEGVINWQDPYNTLTENITSVQQWKDIRIDLIAYTLTKGLSLIK